MSEGLRERRKRLNSDRSVTSDAAASRALPDYKGRPARDNCHQVFQSSILSHRNPTANLRGLLNLCFLIIFAQNARLMIENILKYGVLIKWRFPSDVRDLYENWPILLSLVLMHGSFFTAFVLEKFVLPKFVSGEKKSAPWQTLLGFSLTSLNALTVLLIPYATVRVSGAEPVSASVLLVFSIVWFLKLWSFHHVLHDVRRSLANGETFENVVGGEKALKLPQSLIFREYYEYLAMPTMCYQFEYPRTPAIAWFSVLRHSAELLVCVVLIKIIIEQYVVVTVKNTVFRLELYKSMTVPRIFLHLSERILKLSVPNLCVWLLMFFGLFHHWLNILAEITRFGDRGFYKDWWNSGSFGEYWRKWNLPIHNFFNRHLNKPLLRRGVPRLICSQAVFILSALAHEYMVIVPLHIGWTGLIFTAFILQIPLMYLTSQPFFSNHPTLGNMFFWLTFCFTGQPLAILVYYYLWAVQSGHMDQPIPVVSNTTANILIPHAL